MKAVSLTYVTRNLNISFTKSWHRIFLILFKMTTTAKNKINEFQRTISLGLHSQMRRSYISFYKLTFNQIHTVLSAHSRTWNPLRTRMSLSLFDDFLCVCFIRNRYFFLFLFFLNVLFELITDSVTSSIQFMHITYIDSKRTDEHRNSLSHCRFTGHWIRKQLLFSKWSKWKEQFEFGIWKRKRKKSNYFNENVLYDCNVPKFVMVFANISCWSISINGNGNAKMAHRSGSSHFGRKYYIATLPIGWHQWTVRIPSPFFVRTFPSLCNFKMLKKILNALVACWWKIQGISVAVHSI